MIIQSDLMSGLPLTDESVHCIVASPPYWGLRDYGTAEWYGGDEDCDHQHQRGGVASYVQRTNLGTQQHRYIHTCKKCGAERVDRQLGLERVHDCLAWARGEQPCNECNSDVVPCIVYDPFAGVGTKGIAAYKYGRRFIGTELNFGYIKMANKRLKPYKHAINQKSLDF